MPRYFRPWDECAPQLRENLSPVSDIRYLSQSPEKHHYSSA